MSKRAGTSGKPGAVSSGVGLRPVFTLLHRWVGLVIAGFLIVSGLTGAVISWDHELDDVLNPHLMDAESRGPALPVLDLAQRIEALDPRAAVTYIPLTAEPGKTLAFGLDPKVDPKTGEPYELGYNQVFVDPATGTEQGRRNWGAAWPITTETFVSFLYVLHYSLHIPAMWGIDKWGTWLMGGIALLWTFDGFVGLYLTLPARHAPDSERPAAVERRLARGFWARWAPAWKVKTSGSPYRITFDLHRAFGLWFWGLLLMLAFTAFSLNLYREVFYPIMSTISKVTPSPFDLRAPTDERHPIEARIGFSDVIDHARREAAERGWTDPAGDAFYSREFGIYTVRFFKPGGDHGAAGVGPAQLYFDGADGRYLGDRRPWTGTAADIFVQAQFPLHSGRILGLPGRILVSLMGLAVATLSVTGIVIWNRKRAVRAARIAGGRRSKRGQALPRA